MMNILQIVPELKVGGVERGTVDLSRRLVSLGHKAVVISNGGPLVSQLEDAGVKHYTLPVHQKSFFMILKMIKEVAHILKEEDIHIVHARSRVPAIIGFFACRRAHKTLSIPLRPVFLTTCHGHYSKHIFSRPMGWGRLIIVASNVIAKHMVKDFGVAAERVRLIPRGVDLDEFKFIDSSQRKPGEKTIGMISRITPLKGHPYFIKSISKVTRLVPKLKVLIVGDVPKGKEKYKQELKLLVKRLGLSRYVEFVGKSHNVPAVLAKLDLLVLATTTQEAFGRVIIEAWASGVPVVATKVGGVVDIITHEKNGLLVEPEDTDAMTEAIVKILKDQDLSLRLKEQARKDVEQKYTLDLMVEKTINVYKEALDELKILIIKIGATGDIILSIPVIRAIRKKFPNARITVLVGLESREVFQKCPYVDDIIVYNKDLISKKNARFIKLGKDLQKENFDLTIDLQNNNRSHILSFLSCAPIRCGYANTKLGFLLNYGVKDAKGVALPPVKHSFRVLSPLDIKLEDDFLELWPQEEDKKYIDSLLLQNWVNPTQELVAISPVGSKRWKTKEWPIERFAKLCDMLAAKHIRTIVIGQRNNAAEVDRLLGLTKSKPINACGKTSIMQLAALFERCKVLVSPDSAPVHVAAAVKTPSVILFGPTDPDRHAPPAAGKVTVLKKNLRCSPCYKPVCANPKCMNQINVDEVLKEVSRWINS